MKLDPNPYVHECWDDGTCILFGERITGSNPKDINREFRPRLEFSQNPEDYA